MLSYGPSNLIRWFQILPVFPAFLPGEFHGQRKLAGYSPWGRKKSATAEHISTQIRTQKFREIK